jgi:rhodanese-related sulfurtransferase
MPEIDPAGALAAAGSAFLLDVREADEWAAGHAAAAVHIPLGSLGERVGELPKDRRIICICRSGGRSGRATEALTGVGYDAVNMTGGMQAWAAAGLTMVTDSGSEPTVI